MKRIEGYYWCKIGDEWVVGQYDNGEWQLPGRWYLFKDEDLQEINETPIPPPTN